MSFVFQGIRNRIGRNEPNPNVVAGQPAGHRFDHTVTVDDASLIDHGGHINAEAELHARIMQEQYPPDDLSYLEARRAELRMATQHQRNLAHNEPSSSAGRSDHDTRRA